MHPRRTLSERRSRRTIFNADQHDKAIRDLDYRVDAQMQTILRMEVQTLVERATRWLVNNHARPLDISTAVEQMTSGVRQVQRALPTVQRPRSRRVRQTVAELSQRWCAMILPVTAALPPAYAALTIVHTADQERT